MRLRLMAYGDSMDKQAVKTLLCKRLQLAKIPFSRQGNQIQTASASILFQQGLLVLKKPGKAERQLPYDKVRISQLLWQLSENPLSKQEQSSQFQVTTYLQA